MALSWKDVEPLQEGSLWAMGVDLIFAQPITWIRSLLLYFILHMSDYIATKTQTPDKIAEIKSSRPTVLNM